MPALIPVSSTNILRSGRALRLTRTCSVVLKNSSGHAPGRKCSPIRRILAAIRKLEAKIQADEKRLKEINEKFAKAG